MALTKGRSLAMTEDTFSSAIPLSKFLLDQLQLKRVNDYLKMKMIFLFFLVWAFTSSTLFSERAVRLGIEELFEKNWSHLIQGKNIGFITNHTATAGDHKTSLELLLTKAESLHFRILALFAPEHGINGANWAGVNFDDSKDSQIPIFSLHGKTRRPKEEMLKGIDVLIFDIQDIGSRSYTYISTMFYVMEEAKKKNIHVIVTDRPNPINGIVVDGPMLEDKFRSFVGYVNVPYCHGMTIGELAHFFNEEYSIGCKLTVVPMKGWKRSMTFRDTGLPWIPTSPHIPEPTTVFFYPLTGIIGEMQLLNIGVGYTLPFKIVGAPWIDANILSSHLNRLKLPGVHFRPFYFTPMYGKFSSEMCQGVLIMVDDPISFRPVSTQYMIMGLCKSLYPKEFKLAIEYSKENQEMFNKVNGTDKVLKILNDEKYPGWILYRFQEDERKEFMKVREKYLIPTYQRD